MFRIVVVGQSLRGLIAGWVLRQHPAIEVVIVGGNALAVHSIADELSPSSTSLRSMLQAVGVPHSAYNPRRATLRGGKLRRGKKRGVKRLRFDAEDLALTLCGGARPPPTPKWSVEPGAVIIGREAVPYDYLLLAIPPALSNTRVWFTVPPPHPPRLHVAVVEVRSSPYSLWEEVDTKDTPAGAVCRIFSHSSTCIVESKANGAALREDLKYLFPSGFSLQCVQSPSHWPKCAMPENVANISDALLLGDAIDSAYSLMRRWTTSRRKTP